jgi:hypothetical protein
MAQPAAAKAYEQLPGWSTECFGRFLVDVPGRMKLGEAIPEFLAFPRQPTERYTLDMQPRSPFEGAVSIALTRLLETKPLANKLDFKLVWMQADTYHNVRVVRDGGPVSERADRQQASKRLQLPDDAFIWRYKNQFDFGTLVQSDMRARVLHGELSGEGSLAQAKAVVDTLWPRYRLRKAGEIPGEAGICTPYGFFADPPKLAERDYGLTFKFPDIRHSNLVLSLAITTHSKRTLSPGEEFKVVRPEDMPLPWEEDKKFAREEKEKCRAKLATENSRDLFGCTFAGLTNITRPRAVEYLELGNGQRGRLLAMEYRNTLDGGAHYVVRLEVPGDPDSAQRPWIRVEAEGHPKDSPIPGMTGKEPPSIDEAIATVKTIAASLRLRPGAVADGATVKDTLDGVR